MRFAIKLYLLWKRVEIILCALVVPGLIIESSIANGWVYGGGPLGFMRGFFLELVIYITARQAFLLFGKRHWFGSFLMGLVSAAITYVSAVNNLGYVLAGHEMAGLLGSLGKAMGQGPAYGIYQFLLAVCLPIATVAIALVDLDQFFQHGIEQDHLDNHAVLVDERIMHRDAYIKAQKAQKKGIQASYKDAAQTRAEAFAEKVRGGDLTFGSGAAAVPQAPQIAGPQSHHPNTVTGTVWPVDDPVTGAQNYPINEWDQQNDQWSANPGQAQWQTANGQWVDSR